MLQQNNGKVADDDDAPIMCNGNNKEINLDSLSLSLHSQQSPQHNQNQLSSSYNNCDLTLGPSSFSNTELNGGVTTNGGTNNSHEYIELDSLTTQFPHETEESSQPDVEDDEIISCSEGSSHLSNGFHPTTESAIKCPSSPQQNRVESKLSSSSSCDSVLNGADSSKPAVLLIEEESCSRVNGDFPTVSAMSIPATNGGDSRFVTSSGSYSDLDCSVIRARTATNGSVCLSAENLSCSAPRTEPIAISNGGHRRSFSSDCINNERESECGSYKVGDVSGSSWQFIQAHNYNNLGHSASFIHHHSDVTKEQSPSSSVANSFVSEADWRRAKLDARRERLLAVRQIFLPCYTKAMLDLRTRQEQMGIFPSIFGRFYRK